MNKKEIGSMTAKGGFLNEKTICEKFENWSNDIDAKEWLKIMGYNPLKIQRLKAISIPPKISKQIAENLGIAREKYDEEIRYKKADIQIRVEILIGNALCVENISLKKANKDAGFNQVDKRPVDTYRSMWKFDEEIADWLKLFTGEHNPKEYINVNDYNALKDERRVSFKEMPDYFKNKITDFFSKNKTIICCDILRGRGGLSADWFLVTKEDGQNNSWILKNINYVLNHYAQGEVEITPRGSLRIGRVTMQRKGGTPDPTSLQFKINPLSLFDE
jgi:hypothetical protein